MKTNVKKVDSMDLMDWLVANEKPSKRNKKGLLSESEMKTLKKGNSKYLPF